MVTNVCTVLLSNLFFYNVSEGVEWGNVKVTVWYFTVYNLVMELW